MKREENKPFAADLPAVGEERKPLPAAAASKQQKKGLGRKRTLALLALVFFLFSIIFIVPVGRIPVLRNVSWLMGFSTQETGAMSFFRTLLSWATDSERRSRPGSWSGDGGEISLFDRQMQQAFKRFRPPHRDCLICGRSMRPDGRRDCPRTVCTAFTAVRMKTLRR